jgi:hypothetical protein
MLSEGGCACCTTTHVLQCKIKALITYDYSLRNWIKGTRSVEDLRVM